MKTVFSTLLALGLATSAQAQSQGDAAAGEAGFKKCQACHVVKDTDGNVLAGKNGRSGPNLFGVIGSQAGTVDGFRYKNSIVEAGEAGLVWTEAEVAKYLMDPTKYLRAYLDDSGARSGMSFKYRKEQEAADMAAFLATFATE